MGRAPRPSELVRPRTPTPLRRGFLLSGGRLPSPRVGRAPEGLASDLSAGGVAADLDLALLEVDPDGGVTGLVGLPDHHFIGNGIPSRRHGWPRRPIVALTNSAARRVRRRARDRGERGFAACCRPSFSPYPELPLGPAVRAAPARYHPRSRGLPRDPDVSAPSHELSGPWVPPLCKHRSEDRPAPFPKSHRTEYNFRQITTPARF